MQSGNSAQSGDCKSYFSEKIFSICGTSTDCKVLQDIKMEAMILARFDMNTEVWKVSSNRLINWYVCKK